jgi:DNA-binding Lrp family transcriptional regulator
MGIFQCATNTFAGILFGVLDRYREACRIAMVDALDKKVIGLIQGDLPLDPRPFAVMAEKIGISEEEFVERVRSLKKKGIIRRFGATLRHQEAGFSSNAMIAWLVPEPEVDKVGETMAQFREVTHCYQRRPQMDWKYNLYTMIHGDNENECFKIAQRISQETGIEEYILLFSEKEFKKTSMQYF